MFHILNCGFDMKHFIYHFISILHGLIRTHKWPAPKVSGLIVQLVRTSHRYREVKGSNIVEVLAFLVQLLFNGDDYRLLDSDIDKNKNNDLNNNNRYYEEYHHFREWGRTGWDKNVLKEICGRSRRIGPRLYLKFLFRGKMVDNLSPGRDVMELRSLWHSATCLACIVVRTWLNIQNPKLAGRW